HIFNFFQVLPPDGRLPAINNTNNNPRKVYARCPMCQGKGFYEQVINPLEFNDVLPVPSLNQRNGNGYCVNGHIKHEARIRRNTISDAGEPLKLPVIVREPRKSLPKVHVSESLQPAPSQNGNSKDTINTRQSENMKNTINGRHSVNRQSPVFGNLVFPKVEAPRSMSSLNSEQNNMQIVLQAVHDIVQVSRYNPGLVDPHMSVINRKLCQLLQSQRSQVTRTACQAMRELFRTMQCTQRPEFDEVVSALLQRTADMIRFIRQDSNEALDSMAMYIPPYHSVRALVDKGARIFAKKLVRFLMDHEDFESVFKNVVDRAALGRIEKTLNSLRSQVRESERSARNIRVVT
ncbi:hypothetical protein C0J52_23438, partial [Blattella germanica]